VPREESATTAKPAPSLGVEILRLQMTAIARALSRAFPETQVDIEDLKIIAIFCGVGLVVSLLLAEWIASLRLAPDTNGLDIMDWI
jgi:hypothetical protein